MGVRFISNLTKVYPDMIQVIIYKNPFPIYEKGTKRNKLEVSDDYEPHITSIRRTKSLIKDIVLCNDFDLFCTFTFNPDKVNRFNYTSCYHKISVWLHHQSDKARYYGQQFNYLIIPEQHKSGAWHFHALISHYKGSLRPSGLKTSTGRDIYNITSFRSGFTTAVPIDNKEVVSTYITKYITKDFIKKFNQRRFYCSRGLKRPLKITNSSIFRDSLPIFRQKINETDNTETYLLPYSSL